ncbi:MAG: sigma-70 family RNA polymerase sigma factor [Prevotella ruminicola]|jgi:RNA polymerase sigma factor (sigma-70 family)|uniref:Sigma-70 family RNA polymerase sigma factor n=1 Tax=Xylanibacter ruminicola TaxID=839 RepID=A0A9D5NYY4_XYLRU|nr:sigma-70 family RNA polymerase sigma factor [Xylanibacter ruminicola]
MTTEEFQQQAEALRLQLIGIAQKYLGATDEAEDIVQDAMIKLWLMRDQLMAPVSGFASVVTRNLCIDHLRKQHTTVDISKFPDTEEWSDDGEQIEQMLQVIDTLPSAQRTILRMHHLQGMKTSEIALLLGSSEVSIRQKLSRARRVIRKRLLAIFAAASLLIGVSMMAVYFTRLSTSDDYVIYVYGKKYTDQQTVMAEMKRTMGEMTEENTQGEIEQQLNDLFSN